MICLLALIVFGILGIFSATHRKIAKEAFSCVFRRITLRKCETGLDKRLKSQLTGMFMRKAPRAASFVYKNFEIISWAFTILLVASLVFTGIGAVNLITYGSCDPHSTTCIFSPEEPTCGSSKCEERGCDCEEMGCEAPDFKGCEGECDCKEDICG